jgi:hypothetical protein
MGIDYENINKCEQYQCESFLPNYFFPNLIKSFNNSSLEPQESPKINNQVKKQNISKSRKSTIDEDDIINNNKADITSKKDDKFRNIFMNKSNEPFFSTFANISIVKNENVFSLNIKDDNNIRKSYYSKLIYKNIWTPGMKTKSYNSIFIFDWDDTLFPTSFLMKEGIIKTDVNNLSEEIKILLTILEKACINILNLAINRGNVYIITNSSINWINYSSKIYFPKLKTILDKIIIISARDEYGYMNPFNWKQKAFLKVTKDINTRMINNIICLGDSMLELEAAKNLASKFNGPCLKTIKFKENPGIEDLIRQLNLIEGEFNYIHSKAKSLSITIEQRN